MSLTIRAGAKAQLINGVAALILAKEKAGAQAFLDRETEAEPCQVLIVKITMPIKNKEMGLKGANTLGTYAVIIIVTAAAP